MGKARSFFYVLTMTMVTAISCKASALELYDCDGRLDVTKITGGSLAQDQISKNGLLKDWHAFPLAVDDVSFETSNTSVLIGFAEQKIILGSTRGGSSVVEFESKDCSAKESTALCKKQFHFLAKSNFLPSVSEVVFSYTSPFGFEYRDRNLGYTTPVGSDQFISEGRVKVKEKVEKVFSSKSCRRVSDPLPSIGDLGFN